MIGTFSQGAWLLLARLVTAHLLTDWLFQFIFWKSLISDKKNILILWLFQGAFAGLICCFLSGVWNTTWFPVVISIFRVFMNWWEYKNKKISANLFFILKQSAYLLVILGCWVGLVGISIASVISNGPLWFIGLAYVIIIWPVGSLIGKLTYPWREEVLIANKNEKTKPGEIIDELELRIIKANSEGLAKAGLWLGRLERVLILTFVLLSKYEAIGFLITAKSIFRFSEIKCSRDRKEAEYFLIGTMLSFVIAIIIGILTTWLLKQLVEPGALPVAAIFSLFG